MISGEMPFAVGDDRQKPADSVEKVGFLKLPQG
jgi:hypothetical protein